MSYKKIETDHEYVIIHTNYTSRISKHGGRSKKFKNELKEMSEDSKNNLELLFVVDKLYGEDYATEEGLIIENESEETEEVIKNVRKAGLFKDGIACFRCDNVQYHKILEPVIKESVYCCIFDVECMEYYKSEDSTKPVLLYVEFDSESG
jgi:hypothetical protein